MKHTKQREYSKVGVHHRMERELFPFYVVQPRYESTVISNDSVFSFGSQFLGNLCCFLSFLLFTFAIYGRFFSTGETFRREGFLFSRRTWITRISEKGLSIRCKYARTYYACIEWRMIFFFFFQSFRNVYSLLENLFEICLDRNVFILRILRCENCFVGACVFWKNNGKFTVWGECDRSQRSE